MTTFVDLADATLAAGTMPRVVPQLKSITLGGAVAGVGIEASSFRFGLVHDTISAIEVLTGDGRALVCTPDNEHRDLFHALPNSYGTLGYALKLTARTTPVKRHVHVEHRSHGDPAGYFAELGRLCSRARHRFSRWRRLRPRCAGRDHRTLRRGRPLRQRLHVRAHLLPVAARAHDRLSDDARLPVAMGYRLVLVLAESGLAASAGCAASLGRRRLNSITYQKIMRWNSRWKVTAAWDRLRGLHAESVIQDVDIPLARAAEFLDFLHAQIGILPIWICPIRAPAAGPSFPLYPLTPGAVYVNFGFWDNVRTREAHPAGFHNRKIEHKVTELGGIKSLYSDSYFTPRRILGDLQPAGVRRAQAEIRSGPRASGPVREVRVASLTGVVALKNLLEDFWHE